MKKVLVIGGSYFAGRVFCMLANQDFEITLVNRGKYSMKHLPNITEYKADRKNADMIAQLPYAEYDAVIDFCGYDPGDIKLLFDNLKCKFGRYIFISTADVYDRSITTQKKEDAPLQTEKSSCRSGDYMYSKMLLEKELIKCAEEKACPYTILRPAFIYGPYNYAPRESYYIKKIVQGNVIPTPYDSDSEFQFVYVKDVANALILCAKNETKDNEIFNLSAPEKINYKLYMDTLRKVSDIAFETYPLSIGDVLRDDIQLPFPLTESESELFDGEKFAKAYNFTYTSFEEGMQKTYDAFKAVFAK